MADRELFIYWRVQPGQLAQAMAAAASWQALQRAAWPALQARLYRRADEPDAAPTLMETYAAPGGIDAAWQQRLVTQGELALQPWCQGARHVEVFEPLPSPQPPG